MGSPDPSREPTCGGLAFTLQHLNANSGRNSWQVEKTPCAWGVLPAQQAPGKAGFTFLVCWGTLWWCFWVRFNGLRLNPGKWYSSRIKKCQLFLSLAASHL